MRFLWLKTELLHPIDKGGKIRTYAMLRELKKLHHVTYLTLDDGAASADALERANEYCHEVVRVPFSPPAKGSVPYLLAVACSFATRLPYAVARYRSPLMREAIERSVRGNRPDLVVCDFLAPSLNVSDALGVPVVLFQHNVESAIWERHARVAKGALRQAFFRSQWRRMAAWERRECRRFDHVIAVSEADRDAMRSAYGVTAVSSVPTGVDAQYFSPSGAVLADNFEIVFTGSMDWMPNVDGIVWFCEEVLPLVRAQVPNAVVTVVGRNPGGRVLGLASRFPNVTVTGTVSDIRPYLERAAVVVVPLRVGGGTRLKIYEAMAMGRPVVSTSIGSEGLPMVDGEDILIADGATAFAASVVRLLSDRDYGERMGRRAAARVQRECGWSSVADQFLAVCADLVAHRRRMRSL